MARKKKIFITLLSILAVLTISAALLAQYIINSLIIPNKVRPLIIRALRDSTEKEVSIGRISFSFLTGATIEDLVIPEVIDEFGLEFSRIYLKIKYIPLFLEKVLIYQIVSTPARDLGLVIKADGVYRLAEKNLTSHLKINKFPLSLVGHFVKDMPFDISSGIADIKADIQFDRFKNIKINATAPLKNMKLSANKIEISGDADVQIKLLKKASSDRYDYSGKIDAINIVLSSDKRIPALPLSGGTIQFDSESIAIDNLNLLYKELPYILSCRIDNLRQPRISFELSGNKILINADLLYRDRNIEIKKATLSSPWSKFDVQGSINDLNNPSINLYLIGAVSSKDTSLLPIKAAEIIKDLAIDTLTNIELHLKGNLKEWEKMDALVKLKTPSFKIRGFELTDLDIMCKGINGALSGSLKAKAYEGVLDFTLERILLKEKIPFLFRLSIEDVNLKELNEKALKLKQEISGNFVMELNAKGPLRDINKISGDGWFEVTNGRLWELPLFKDLTKFIAVPGLEDSVFSEAHGNFVIANAAATTRDLQFISNKLTLDIKGSLYLSGNLDFHVKTQFPQEETKPTSELGKLQDLILRGASSVVDEIQITGSLKKPEYKVVPASIIDNVLQNIFQ